MADDFAEALRAHLPSPCLDRPFECDGLPQTCDVMLIGENPATSLGVDWWLHWSDTEGCNKKVADGAYLEARTRRLEIERAQGKKHGKLFSLTHSRTVMLEERLRAGGSRLLVTNVYRNGRPKGAGPHRVSNLDVIRLLFAHMPLLVAVVVQGGKAQKAMRHCEPPPDVRPIRTRHFSKWSNVGVEKLAADLMQAINDDVPAKDHKASG